MRAKGKVCDTIKRYDYFKHSVGMTYNGKESFPTGFGTTMTVLMLFGMMAILIQKVLDYSANPIKSISTQPFFNDQD